MSVSKNLMESDHSEETGLSGVRYTINMLIHPITVVLNVFGHWKGTGLKVGKFMSIQKQEAHIGHVKQLKRDRYQDLYFFLSSIACELQYFPKK